MFRRILVWLPVILWMGVIFFFSSRTGLTAAQIQTADFIVKKLAHVTVFFILFVLCYFAFVNNRLSRSFLFSLSYAFSDEIHQLFTPTRTATLRDVLIDSIGITLAYLVISRKLWKHIKLHR